MEILDAILGLLGRNIGGTLLRVGGGGMLGLLLGIVFVVAAYKLVIARGWVDLGRTWDRWVRRLAVAIWVVVFPLATAATGVAWGAGLATRAVIVNEHLGEKAGALAFGGVVYVCLELTDEPAGEGEAAPEATGAAADAPPAVEVDVEVDVAPWLREERKIPITEIAERIRGLPDEMTDGMMEELEKNVSGEEDGVVKALALRIARSTFSWLARSKVEEQLATIAPVIADLERRDAESDADGEVTVHEVAASISRVHLEPYVADLIVSLFVSQALAVLAIVPLVALGTVIPCRFFAWLLPATPTAPATPPETGKPADAASAGATPDAAPAGD